MAVHQPAAGGGGGRMRGRAVTDGFGDAGGGCGGRVLDRYFEPTCPQVQPSLRPLPPDLPESAVL